MRLTALLPFLALTACTDEIGMGEFGLDAAGQVIDGEFVIAKHLSEQELEVLGLEELDYDDVLGAGLYEATEEVSASRIARALHEQGRGAAFVEHNRPVFARSVNDPYRGYQWNLDMLEVETAWETATGKGITVAVVDSGVSASGEDTPVNLVAGWDFVDNDSNPTDTNGHGTHVAGTIAQATDNGIGVSGVAPDVNLMAVRVLGTNGGGDAYSVARGIVYAVDNGADVINMSLGSSYGSSVEQQAIQYAYDNGVVVVAASGNESVNQVGYPAAYPETIAVGSVGASFNVPSYSNGGSGLTIVAPGGDLSSDDNGDGYADGILQETFEYGSWTYTFWEGTSMATPHVSAAAALLLEAGADPYDVANILANTADDLGGAGWSTRSGYGALNLVEALAAVDGGSTGTEEPVDDVDTSEPVDTADTTAPVISGIGGSRNGSNLTLYWTTDEPATSEITFEDYGTFGDSSTLTTDHELRFTINSRETYTFTLVSEDAYGNVGESVTYVTRP